MKTRWAGLLSAGLFVLASYALAQRPAMRIYNPDTETTVKGKVEQVKQITGRRGWNGTHLVLKTDAETMDVHVGPSSYLVKQGFSFAEGDQVEVVGSRVKMGESEAVIAREINKDGKRLVLRDAQGVPAWAGGRRWKQ